MKARAARLEETLVVKRMAQVKGQSMPDVRRSGERVEQVKRGCGSDEGHSTTGCVEEDKRIDLRSKTIAKHVAHYHRKKRMLVVSRVSCVENRYRIAAAHFRSSSKKAIMHGTRVT